jgi:hypothetical protein
MAWLVIAAAKAAAGNLSKIDRTIRKEPGSAFRW